MLLEIFERRGGIGERRPVAHGAPVGDAFLPARLGAPLLGEPLVNDGEQIPVEAGRRRPLLRGFMARMRLEDLILRQRPHRLGGKRPQRRQHAALPVDQRAVAIEGKDLEIGELHRTSPRNYAASFSASARLAWWQDHGLAKRCIGFD